SPLNLPATRTLPPPSILPSMVMSAAISDSLRGRPVSARAIGAAAGLGTSSGFDGASCLDGSHASGAGVGVRREVVSFHMDMTLSYRGGVARLTPKRDRGNDYIAESRPLLCSTRVLPSARNRPNAGSSGRALRQG